MKIMKCKLIEKRLIFFIENELQEKESILVKAHLEICPECRLLYEKMEADLEFLKTDRVHESNPFFHVRVAEKIKNPLLNKRDLRILPKKQYIVQFAFYMLLGIFALIGGIYLGSGTVVDESVLSNQTDTADFQLFANSYNYNFNQNIYQIESDSNGE